jgi:type IV pilus assembly protein PilN
MAKINLLPWRDARRKEQNKEFGVLAGVAAGVGVVLVAMGQIAVSNAISSQQERNTYMDQRIAELDKEIKEIAEIETQRAKLLQRLNTIESLQSNRTEVVHLFDEVVQAIPDGLYLTGLKQAGTTISLDGVAESNTRVTDLTRNIKKSRWLVNPEIGQVASKEVDFVRAANFSMKMGQVNPDKPVEEPAASKKKGGK